MSEHPSITFVTAMRRRSAEVAAHAPQWLGRWIGELTHIVVHGYVVMIWAVGTIMQMEGILHGISRICWPLEWVARLAVVCVLVGVATGLALPAKLRRLASADLAPAMMPAQPSHDSLLLLVLVVCGGLVQGILLLVMSLSTNWFEHLVHLLAQRFLLGTVGISAAYACVAVSLLPAGVVTGITLAMLGRLVEQRTIAPPTTSNRPVPSYLITLVAVLVGMPVGYLVTEYMVGMDVRPQVCTLVGCLVVFAVAVIVVVMMSNWAARSRTSRRLVGEDADALVEATSDSTVTWIPFGRTSLGQLVVLATTLVLAVCVVLTVHLVCLWNGNAGVQAQSAPAVCWLIAGVVLALLAEDWQVRSSINTAVAVYIRRMGLALLSAVFVLMGVAAFFAIAYSYGYGWFATGNYAWVAVVVGAGMLLCVGYATGAAWACGIHVATPFIQGGTRRLARTIGFAAVGFAAGIYAAVELIALLGSLMTIVLVCLVLQALSGVALIGGTPDVQTTRARRWTSIAGLYAILALMIVVFLSIARIWFLPAQGTRVFFDEGRQISASVVSRDGHAHVLIDQQYEYIPCTRAAIDGTSWANVIDPILQSARRAVVIGCPRLQAQASDHVNTSARTVYLQWNPTLDRVYRVLNATNTATATAVPPRQPLNTLLTIRKPMDTVLVYWPVDTLQLRITPNWDRLWSILADRLVNDRSMVAVIIPGSDNASQYARTIMGHLSGSFGYMMVAEYKDTRSVIGGRLCVAIPPQPQALARLQQALPEYLTRVSVTPPTTRSSH